MYRLLSTVCLKRGNQIIPLKMSCPWLAGRMLVAFNIKASLRLIPLKDLLSQFNFIWDLFGGIIVLLRISGGLCWTASLSCAGKIRQSLRDPAFQSWSYTVLAPSLYSFWKDFFFFRFKETGVQFSPNASFTNSSSTQHRYGHQSEQSWNLMSLPDLIKPSFLDRWRWLILF